MRRFVLYPGLVGSAFHPDSLTSINLYTDGGDTAIPWTGETGTPDLQDIPAVAGLTGNTLYIDGNLSDGDYFAILEVRATWTANHD